MKVCLDIVTMITPKWLCGLSLSDRSGFGEHPSVKLLHVAEFLGGSNHKHLTIEVRVTFLAHVSEVTDQFKGRNVCVEYVGDGDEVLFAHR